LNQLHKDEREIQMYMQSKPRPDHYIAVGI